MTTFNLFENKLPKCLYGFLSWNKEEASTSKPQSMCLGGRCTHCAQLGRTFITVFKCKVSVELCVSHVNANPVFLWLFPAAHDVILKGWNTTYNVATHWSKFHNVQTSVQPTKAPTNRPQRRAHLLYSHTWVFANQLGFASLARGACQFSWLPSGFAQIVRSPTEF